VDAGTLLLVVVIGYLLGSISFSRVITRLVSPETDLGNIEIGGDGTTEAARLRHYGATTASIKLGPRWGCTIGLLDILKTTIPTLVVRFLFPEQPYFLAVAVMCMVGHIWPIYYRFKGGGGMSSIYGGFLAVDWLGAIVCSTAGLLLGLFVIKDILVAYISGTWLMILWLWFRTRDPAYLIYALTVNILFVVALLPEIRAQIKAHREGKADLQAGMETFPMGRGMLKIMNHFRIHRSNE